MTGNVLIFYEKHTETAPTKALISLMPFLSSHGLKTHCFEDPSDYSKENFISSVKSAIEYHKYGLKVRSLFEGYARNLLVNHFSNEEEINSLSRYQQKNIIEQVRLVAKGYVEALKLSLKLVEAMDQNNVDFCTMDLPNQERLALEQSSNNNFEKIPTRDKHMVQNILSHIHKGDVSVLVGSDHFNIATELKAKSIDVREYYITTSGIEPILPGIARGDYCLRGKETFINSIMSFFGLGDDSSKCDNHKLDGIVIDLNYDPSLNATKLIADDLTGTVYSDYHSGEL